MNEKDFDNLIKNSLSSDEVPSELNAELFRKVRKKRSKGKIYNFAKFGSAIAAVFICAVVILSYYNSDSQNKFTNSSQEDSAPNTSSSQTNADHGEENTPAPASEVSGRARMAEAPTVTQPAEDATAPSARNSRIMMQAPEKATEEPENQMTKNGALQLAKEACDVSYDSTNVSYDSDTKLWCVTFFSSEKKGKDQNVFIDNNGIIRNITFEE